MVSVAKYIWPILLIMITGCTRWCGENHADLEPEEVVEAYVETVFNITNIDQRDALMQFTTGELKDAIAGANEETFTRAYIKPNIKLTSYSLIERRDRTPRETEITFRLVYDKQGKENDGDTEATITAQNTVSVIREKGLWLIRDLVGAKQSIVFPFSEAATIKPGEGGEKSEEESTTEPD